MQLTNSRTHRIIAMGVSLTIIGSLLLVTTPSYAFDITKNWKNIITLIQNIQKDWAATKKDAEDSTDENQGDMGEADPVASSDDLKDRIADEVSLPVAQQQAQDLERDLTRASVSTVTGKAGQEDRAQKIDSTVQTAQEAEYLGEQAQGMDASQNILKVIAAQNGLIVTMLARQHTDSLESRPDAAQTNLMLSQIASHSASERKQQDNEKSALLSLQHEVAAMSVLDPAYQE